MLLDSDEVELHLSYEFQQVTKVINNCLMCLSALTPNLTTQMQAIYRLEDFIHINTNMTKMRFDRMMCGQPGRELQ